MVFCKNVKGFILELGRVILKFKSLLYWRLLNGKREISNKEYLYTIFCKNTRKLFNQNKQNKAQTAIDVFFCQDSNICTTEPDNPDVKRLTKMLLTLNVIKQKSM